MPNGRNNPDVEHRLPLSESKCPDEHRRKSSSSSMAQILYQLDGTKSEISDQRTGINQASNKRLSFLVCSKFFVLLLIVLLLS